MDKQANNELIARFMGFNPDERYEKSGNFQVWTSKESKNAILAGYLDYDKNWNMLMAVIKKCHTIDAPTKEGWSKSDRIEYRIDNNDIWNNNIIDVWKSVVEFVKWYNQQK